jgi:hypothetical protein
MPAKKGSKTSKDTARSASRKRAPAPAAEITVPIYQLKVTLKNFKPSIWRRIQIRSDANLGELHGALQLAMGWSNCHLHHFIVGKRPDYLFIGAPGLDADEDMVNEDEVLVSQVLPAAKTKMIYEYDFGDSWEHEVALEKIVEAEKGVYYPRCLAGENACPPEDVGGVWGYADFLKAIADPDHEEHESSLEWVGEDFDPKEFDLEYVNKRLKGLKSYLSFRLDLL